MTEWLRQVDPVKGPVTGVVTSLQPGIARPFFWYSLAKLSPAFAESLPGGYRLPLTGAGWSRDRKLSRRKAVVEAIERSAHYLYKEAPWIAGLDLDPTSTGFAALPIDHGVNAVRETAYHEAVERWALNRLNDGPGLPLSERRPPRFSRLRFLFSGRAGKWRIFSGTVAPGSTLVLSLFQLPEGGIVPGSAVAGDFSSALERATLETFNHLRKLDRVLQGKEQLPPKITAQRLWHYAHSPDSAARILRKLENPRALREVPRIALEKELPGDWDSEIRVYRVVLKDSKPLNQGPVERLMI